MSTEEYRTALALNNMAITLMQRGCYEQSSKTLKESQLLMDAAFGLETGNPTEAFDAASERLSKSHKASPSSNVDINDVDERDFKALLSAANSKSIFFPVRISSFGEDHQVTATVMQHNITIFYNQGICNLLASKDHLDKKASLNSALENLHVALEMVEDVLEKIDINAQDERLYMILISVMILNCLRRVHQGLGSLHQAEKVQHTAKLLCSELEDDSFTCLTCMQEEQRAAAAA
jgi:hypothetical protein